MSALLNRTTQLGQPPLERRLTVAESASAAGRHPVTIRRDLEAGVLHGTQRMKGGRWIVRESCLDAYLDGTRCHHQVRESVVVDLALERQARGGAR